MQRWSSERATDLAALAAAALPGEDLSVDELLTSCWDDLDGGPLGRGAVLATDDGAGAVAVVVRPDPAGGTGTGFVQLLAVHPDARGRGLGHELLDAAERWAWEQGAAELRLEGAPPFYLWPGVDADAAAMHALARSRGYDEVGTSVNMALSAGFRAPAPEAVEVRRVIDDGDRERVRALIERVWPEWWAEAARAIEHGCCHGAFATPQDDADVVAVGFACHSVSRAGWLGPMGTDPEQRGRGVGLALVGQVCRDLMIAEYSTTEICWAGPQDFYAKAGAAVSRTFVRYRRRRP